MLEIDYHVPIKLLPKLEDKNNIDMTVGRSYSSSVITSRLWFHRYRITSFGLAPRCFEKFSILGARNGFSLELLSVVTILLLLVAGLLFSFKGNSVSKE